MSRCRRSESCNWIVVLQSNSVCWQRRFSGWWQLDYFLIFTPRNREMIQFDGCIFFTWVGKNTTNQFLVTCYTLIVDEVDCEFPLLSVTGVIKQEHHTNHPNFRQKIEPERTKSKKITPPKKETISLPTRTVWSENLPFRFPIDEVTLWHMCPVSWPSAEWQLQNSCSVWPLRCLAPALKVSHQVFLWEKPWDGNCKTFLGGGFIFFNVHPRTLGKMNPFWRAYFQMRWFNHQRSILRAP